MMVPIPEPQPSQQVIVAAAPVAHPPPLPTKATVLVEAYTESLCIDCKNFLTHSLDPVYHELGPVGIMELKVIPFGNSKLHAESGNVRHSSDTKKQSQSKHVECQHGDAECDANLWEQCAVEQYEPNVYIGFIDCLEQVLPMGYQDTPFDEHTFRTCAASTNQRKNANNNSDMKKASNPASMDFSKLKTCHDHQAWEMQEKYGSLTPPEHDHVPWIVVDGQHFDEDHDDLLQTICDSYQKKGGDPKPACSLLLRQEVKVDQRK